jgi:hypothetical protein
MAGRILNRRELRAQADHAEQSQVAVPQPAVAAVPSRPKKSKGAASGTGRKPRKVKAPPRLRARWGVFDAGMKQVAIFDYNQRADADAKLADLLARKKGIHFLQIVKEPMPEAEATAAPSQP